LTTPPGRISIIQTNISPGAAWEANYSFRPLTFPPPDRFQGTLLKITRHNRYLRPNAHPSPPFAVRPHSRLSSRENFCSPTSHTPIWLLFFFFEMNPSKDWAWPKGFFWGGKTSYDLTGAQGLMGEANFLHNVFAFFCPPARAYQPLNLFITSVNISKRSTCPFFGKSFSLAAQRSPRACGGGAEVETRHWAMKKVISPPQFWIFIVPP